MPSFESNGVEIAYETSGDGPAILLIHGFASNGGVNWQFPGWVDLLAKAGLRVITMDNRGHGRSTKFHDPAAYRLELMAEDARGLLDHLGVATAIVMGYSMGARIAAWLAISHPARVSKAILGGMAGNISGGLTGGEEVAAALEVASLDAVQGAVPRSFRAFAEQTRSDLKALAACIRTSRRKISLEDLARIACPVLVVIGDGDDIAGPMEPVLAAIPGARGVILPNRNHMNAVGDRVFKEAVLAFIR